ncbi:hypothetical protein HF670_10250 [Acidithiobacillus thiooxidans]|uniref:rhamnosyltransferase WsaF family glycosyltransferase n=1 Tax=Acidithiobacillus thiooxidans TaxID=930 RepID=UPI001C06FCAA|nr:hypothetical protein [Acidithiobacillus thiooxidans]MBU2839940.1 hypothetical protein [Acidithiobacillus thiooxidans]
MLKIIIKSARYWRINGTNRLLKRIKVEILSHTRTKKILANNNQRKNLSVSDLLVSRFIISNKMCVRHTNRENTGRVNIITDSVRAGSLFGGVGTALLFAAHLANRLGVQCRVITRTEEPDIQGVFNFYKLYDIKLQKELQFKFEPCDNTGRGVDFTDEELFITTSWWTTASTLTGVDPRKIIYLLQEDERMFYPYGDDWIKAHEIMSNEDIFIVVNTKILFDHFVAHGFVNIIKNDAWFEPAFPMHIYHITERQEKKKNFFFYARPNNPRNLFYFGLKVIDDAIMLGIINTSEWNIIIVGSDIPEIEFFGKICPVRYDKMPWNEYSKLLGKIDVGLSLMCTPHPSYPPLDLAASGAVVVTNKFGLKQNLSKYSQNIICSDLNLGDMLSAIDTAIKLSENKNEKNKNYHNAPLEHSWDHSFTKVLDQICGEIYDRI